LDLAHDYEYDVFVSYKQDEEWIGWVRAHFVPKLRYWLREALLRDPAIWWDQNLAPGQAWTHTLATRLATARAVVALWSPWYFQSNWCVSELAHMLTRQQECGMAKLGDPWTLVFPVLVHAKAIEFVPHEARHIVPLDVTTEADPWMADGPLAQALSQKIRGLAIPLADAIRNPPPYDPAWAELSFDDVRELFHADPVELTTSVTL
jgi:hypothetical protein